jgi:hypothetical protein
VFGPLVCSKAIAVSDQDQIAAVQSAGGDARAHNSCRVAINAPELIPDTDPLLDHLVGGGHQRFWDGKAKRLAGLEVDHQL